jgi:hypothetical protein
MKKFLIAALIAFTAAGSAFAGWGGPGIGPSGHGLPEAGDPGSDLSTVTISGALAIVNGSLVVQDGSNTYNIKMISRLMRTVPGLVIGARVTLTGDTSKIMDDGSITGHYFKAKSLTFNGQAYTVSY